jgi:hypothetical protein
MKQEALSNKAFDISAPQKMICTSLQINRALISHDFPAIGQNANFDAYFLRRLSSGNGRKESE